MTHAEKIRQIKQAEAAFLATKYANLPNCIPTIPSSGTMEYRRDNAEWPENVRVIAGGAHTDWLMLVQDGPHFCRGDIFSCCATDARMLEIAQGFDRIIERESARLKKSHWYVDQVSRIEGGRVER